MVCHQFKKCAYVLVLGMLVPVHTHAWLPSLSGMYSAVARVANTIARPLTPYLSKTTSFAAKNSGPLKLAFTAIVFATGYVWGSRKKSSPQATDSKMVHETQTDTVHIVNNSVITELERSALTYTSNDYREKLTSEARDKQDAIGKLQAAIDGKNEQIRTLTEARLQLQEKLERETKDRQCAVGELQATINDRNGQISALTHEKQQLQEELQREATRWQAEISRMRDGFNGMDEQIRVLTAGISRYQELQQDRTATKNQPAIIAPSPNFNATLPVTPAAAALAAAPTPLTVSTTLSALSFLGSGTGGLDAAQDNATKRALQFAGNTITERLSMVHNTNTKKQP